MTDPLRPRFSPPFIDAETGRVLEPGEDNDLTSPGRQRPVFIAPPDSADTEEEVRNPPPLPPQSHHPSLRSRRRRRSYVESVTNQNFNPLTTNPMAMPSSSGHRGGGLPVVGNTTTTGNPLGKTPASAHPSSSSSGKSPHKNVHHHHHRPNRPTLQSQATITGPGTTGTAWKPLTNLEKKYLLAVERGDLGSVRRFLESDPTQLSPGGEDFNPNCTDPIGRTALLMAIDNENLEMIELLISYGVEMKDALLHAINEEFVEAVELLLDHEEAIHVPGSPYSWEAVERETFTSDVTPLILAAHKNNYEIIKLLLDRGISPIPSPHDARCGCKSCRQSRLDDHLRHSRSRINAYRALASPSLIALSSKDPILTAFELSWQLRRLSFLEPEFKTEYLELRKQCQQFATALLDHTRTTHELEVLLNYDPKDTDALDGESSGRMTLSRLKLAIRCKQKKFCAHANVQQLLASIWYEGLPGFRRKNIVVQTLQIIFIGFLFPFLSLAYILAPCTRIGQVMKKPFIKFICHSASYMTFLVLLALASQRIETDIFDFDISLNHEAATKRGAPPTLIELMVLPWVLGLIWSEIKQLWELGLADYLSDMWNILDFITNSLYVATITLRVIAYLQVQKEILLNTGTAHLSRESWDAFDPILLAEGLFAAANIFSSLKLVYIFSVNPHLGPLQISLGRMVIDILKFFSIYTLVCFAFACGMNQLLWYYADMERQVCIVQSKSLHNGSWIYSYPSPSSQPNVSGPIVSSGGRRMFMPKSANEACIAYRKFSNLFESLQTLFWATFGLIDLENFELTGIQSYTRFWGMTMFGCYCIINVTVLLNLLIAMMNHSYQIISEQADTEWKFARTKLWMSYFEDGGTVPIPFNIIPTPKSFLYLFKWIVKKFCYRTKYAKNEAIKTIRRKARQASERDHRYQAVMRSLVRRYITNEQRTAERQRGVTEDDCNEIKQDISALRFELMEVLGSRLMGGHIGGMPSAAMPNCEIPQGKGGQDGQDRTLLGRRGRKRERRLMKGFDFNLFYTDTTTSLDDQDPMLMENPVKSPPGKAGVTKSPPTTTTTRSKFVRLARGLAGKRMVRTNKWKQLIEATRSRVIRSSDSVNSVVTGQKEGPHKGHHQIMSMDHVTGRHEGKKPSNHNNNHSTMSDNVMAGKHGGSGTADSKDWKTQDEEEVVGDGSGVGVPKARIGNPTRRRSSNIQDFDLATKRGIFARKVTTLMRGADNNDTTDSVIDLVGGGSTSRDVVFGPDGNGDPHQAGGSSSQEQFETTHSSSTFIPPPTLMVTLPSNVMSDAGGSKLPSVTIVEQDAGQIVAVTHRPVRRSKRRVHHHHTGHHHHSGHHIRTSRSRSPSKSPSKSPSPTSLNTSMLLGINQIGLAQQPPGGQSSQSSSGGHLPGQQQQQQSSTMRNEWI